MITSTSIIVRVTVGAMYQNLVPFISVVPSVSVVVSEKKKKRK